MALHLLCTLWSFSLHTIFSSCMFLFFFFLRCMALNYYATVYVHIWIESFSIRYLNVNNVQRKLMSSIYKPFNTIQLLHLGFI